MLSLTELSWYDKNGKLQNILDFVHPVGSIYMTMDSQNPSTLFGGTWVRWGEGRVPVGVSANDSDFDAVGKIGGEKAHPLTEGEMPSHRHVGQYTYSHKYTDYMHPDPTSPIIPVEQGTREVEVQYKIIQDKVSTVDCHPKGTGNANDIHYSEKVTSTYGVADDGGNAPHNNLQPYITCYMWKRTE